MNAVAPVASAAGRRVTLGWPFCFVGVSMKINVYIDGFNFYYGCLKGSSDKWLDFGAFCSASFPQDAIHRIRYFTARVKPKPSNPNKHIRQEQYLRALETVPNL